MARPHQGQPEPGGRRTGGTTRFRLRGSLSSSGDHFWIEDADGALSYRVDVSSLHARRTVVLEDARGSHVCRIRADLPHARETVAVERPDGTRIATVHKALVSPLQQRWKVDVEGGDELAVQGNVADHEYILEQDGVKVAEISERRFRASGTYGVQVAAGLDPPLALSIAVALDVTSR